MRKFLVQPKTLNVLVESTLLAMVGNINKLHNKIIWSFFLKSYIKTAKMKLSLHDFSIVEATALYTEGCNVKTFNCR